MLFSFLLMTFIVEIRLRGYVFAVLGIEYRKVPFTHLFTAELTHPCHSSILTQY